MEKLKTVFQKILYPPLWLLLLLTVVSTASLIAVFLEGLEDSAVAYIVYVLAFYTLTAVCFFAAKIIPQNYGKLKQKVYSNKFGNRYLTDAIFKTHISLYLSLVINLLYAAINIVSGFLYRSVWFAILAGYYIILAVMRFLLVRFVRKIGIGKDRILEYKRSRLCGIILMALNLTLSGAVLMIIYQNKGYEYNGILIYVMAMYTFYVTTHSITDLIKYRKKYNSPIMATAKIITFSAALVSMLSLETAMLSQFGGDTTPQTRRALIAATGAGVSIIVLTLSVYMIVNATKQIKRSKQQNG